MPATIQALLDAITRMQQAAHQIHHTSRDPDVRALAREITHDARAATTLLHQLALQLNALTPDPKP